MSVDPAIVGARVLENLAGGRQRAIAAAQVRRATLTRVIRPLIDDDSLAGHPRRGRPGRIQRRLRRAGIYVTERHVRRILDTLSSMSGARCDPKRMDSSHWS